MRAGSLFSGVGGLDLGLHRAGFEHAFFCESDPYRRSVLAAHWPGVPIYEDVCDVGVRLAEGNDGSRPREAGHDEPVARGDGRVGEFPSPGGRKPANRQPDSRAHRADVAGGEVSEPWRDGWAVDLLCGGFPCQDVSVAGKRQGLAGDRSGLFFEFARIIDVVRPQWLLVENVPGLLSSNSGRDFGIVVGTLADLGYGMAWRILDSRFFGVPQRRRRVFILGTVADGDPRAAAERAGQILAVGTRCEGHSATSRETREEVAGTLGRSSPEGRAGRSTDLDGHGAYVSYALTAGGSQHRLGDGSEETFVVSDLFGKRAGDGCVVARRKPSDAEFADAVVVGSDFDCGEDRVGDLIGVPAVPVGDGHVQMDQDGAGHCSSFGTVTSESMNPSGAGFKGRDGDTFLPLPAPVGVRRLTPTECERLQAWPDGWTDPDGTAPDSRRYAACGDGVTATVAEWIGWRLLAPEHEATR